MVNEYVLLLGGQAVENKFNWSVILSFWIVCIQSPKFNIEYRWMKLPSFHFGVLTFK